MLYRMGSSIVPDSYTGSAGGHFEKEELNDAKSCVLRELREEIGLTEDDISGLALRYVTLRLKNNEIRQNYYFFAKLNQFDENLTSVEGKLEWVDLSEVKNYEMPVTAKYVVEHYLETGIHTEVLYGGVTTD